jgi:hypothetical protein
MKHFFFMVTLSAVLMVSNTSLACRPAPPPNTNWLQLEIKFDTATFPKDFMAKADGELVSFHFPKGSVVRYDNPKWSKSSPTKWGKLPEQTHFMNIANIEFAEGSYPTFNGSKPQKSIPSPQPFEIPISIDQKRHTLKGEIIYSRNPNYDPDVMKKWKDPCANFNRL